MEKLIELLGKIIQALFSSKTLWFVVVAAAILTLVLLLIADTPLLVAARIVFETRTSTIAS